MKVGYVNLRRKRTRKQMKVKHEEEGSSSNCPVYTPVTKPMLD